MASGTTDLDLKSEVRAILVRHRRLLLEERAAWFVHFPSR
jgi:hypothetical protein